MNWKWIWSAFGQVIKIAPSVVSAPLTASRLSVPCTLAKLHESVTLLEAGIVDGGILTSNCRSQLEQSSNEKKDGELNA